MRIIKPQTDSTFWITEQAEWPSIECETDCSGPHTWQWQITWHQYCSTGTAATDGPCWHAEIANLGGTLEVTAQAGNEQASVRVYIRGKNPDKILVDNHIKSGGGGTEFQKIVEYESAYKHYIDGEPVISFDSGYGICQLTTPPPTFAQVWNWRLNIDSGLKLFAQKRAEAIKYLSQSHRTYTDHQLAYETVCRWNGGHYHVWDDAKGVWVRNPNILCDTQTINIGWDMSNPENKGLTEQKLHERDKQSYNKPPQPGSHWRYYGVCYADRLLGPA